MAATHGVTRPGEVMERYALLALLLPTAAAAQFVATKDPTHLGVRAAADLPAAEHKRNVGGSDGGA